MRGRWPTVSVRVGWAGTAVAASVRVGCAGAAVAAPVGRIPAITVAAMRQLPNVVFKRMLS